jgi:hypothetical protein
MTTSKKTGKPRKGSKRLNVRKETLKDLEPRSGKDVKGGTEPIGNPTGTCYCPAPTSGCSKVQCPSPTKAR